MTLLFVATFPSVVRIRSMERGEAGKGGGWPKEAMPQVVEDPFGAGLASEPVTAGLIGVTPDDATIVLWSPPPFTGVAAGDVAACDDVGDAPSHAAALLLLAERVCIRCWYISSVT